MVDKTPAEITSGNASRGSVVHASDAGVSDLSRSHAEEDISRLQSAVNEFDNTLQYKVGDLVLFSTRIFRNKTPNTVPNAFVANEWDQPSARSLQEAYDGGRTIQTATGEPVEIESPSSTVFQSVFEIKDQNSKFPFRIEAGGEIEQQPFNLKTVAIVNQGDNGASLVSATHLETHSRFLFVNTEEVSSEGIEIFSLANPELPRRIGLVSDASLTKPNMFKMHGDILYVLDGSSPAKLLMFDIGNPSIPKLLGTITSGDIGTTFDADSEMIVSGKYIFLTNKGTTPATTFVNVIDITDPTAPILVNKITNGQSGTTGGNYVLDQIGAMEIHENFMFLANHGADSIELLDISDLEDILHVSNIADGAGGALLTEVIKISATRDVIFFSSFTDKSIQAIDYSVPATPVLTDSFKDGDDGVTLGNVTDSDVAGRYLYFYSAIGGVQSITTFDIQDATDIKFLETSMIEALVPLIGTGTTGQAITGDHIYGLNSGATSQLYAVRLSGSDVQSTRVGSARFGNADIKDSLTTRIFDVSESAHFGTRGILVNGPISGQESATIKAVDGDPVKIIAPNLPTANKGEYAESGEAYVVDDIVTLTTSEVLTYRNLVPITDPAGVFDPTKWLLLTIFQPVISVEDLDGNLPLRIEGGGEIEQVPFNLKTASVTRAGDNGAILLEGRQLDIHSRFLFVTQDPAVGLGAIEIFSLANPEEPESVGLVTDALIDDPRIIRMFGDILYVIAAEGGTLRLLLFDIGNPSDPKLLNPGGFASGVGGVEFDGRNDMILQGKYLFVGSFGQDAGSSFITILDVSDPTNIQLVSSIADGNISTLTNLAGTLTGYTVGEAITLSGGTGSGATADAVFGDGVIATISAITGGSGYTVGEKVTLAGDMSGIGATGEVVISGGAVQSIVFTSRGSGFVGGDAETVTITGVTSGANNASFTVSTIVNDAISSITLTDGGEDYTVGDTLTITGDLSAANTATIDVDTVISLNRPRTFTVHENFLYVGNQGTDSIELIDISDITKPQFVSTITDNGTTIRLVDPSMIHATRDVLHVISNADKTLQAIDYRVPATPVARGQLIDAFGTSASSDIGGRYLYVFSRSVPDKIITTIDLQDADNLVKLEDSLVTGADSSLTPTDIVVSGDHAFGLASNEEPTELYSIRLSGIDSQSCRIGEGRFGNIDVKDDFSGRQGDFSESLHVGTRGILSNGPIAGQDSSSIVRKVITLIDPASVELDFADDVTNYIIDLDTLVSDVAVTVTNTKPGHKILIKHSPSSGGDVLTFGGAIFFLTSSLAPSLDTVNDNYVELEVLDNSGGADTILVKIYDF